MQQCPYVARKAWNVYYLVLIEMFADLCINPLSFGVVCYAAINNWWNHPTPLPVSLLVPWPQNYGSLLFLLNSFFEFVLQLWYTWYCGIGRIFSQQEKRAVKSRITKDPKIGSDGKPSAYKAGDLGSIPGLGRSGEGNGNPLQYSCLENPMVGGTW